ncbi:MAG: hypothetical protein PHW02_04970 [bacterium]|nr:hypothetical protein [bacterium]
MKKLIFVLIILSSSILFASLSEWNSLKTDPSMTDDPYSFLTFPSSLIESDQFKTIISLDYFDTQVSALGLFESYWGRLGLIIDRQSNSLRDSLIKNMTGRDIVPTILGISGGKKINNFNFGLSLFGYKISEYLKDNASPYNNTTLDISEFCINPSITMSVNEMLAIDVAGDISILSAGADDVNRILKSASPAGYKITGRVTQMFSENSIALLAKFSRNPYGLEEIQQGESSGDVELEVEDTLSVKVLLSLESFSYVSTYLSAAYEQQTLSSKLSFVTGSESEEVVTVSKFPELSAGFSFYINRNFAINTGASGCWLNTKTESAPLLSPEIQTSGFEYDLRIGALISFDNLRIALDLSKEAVAYPFFISGNAINGLDINLGISYTGYEF